MYDYWYDYAYGKTRIYSYIMTNRVNTFVLIGEIEINGFKVWILFTIRKEVFGKENPLMIMAKHLTRCDALIKPIILFLSEGSIIYKI